ncbi:MAG: hypothetical protein HC894_00600 [Microcoleus sp. SM1_3_4]|nr:hypothetical protein [Microcoleus sp. SM1_3_4]
METKTSQLPAREMHKIVWASVGVLILFFITFPISMWRVSQKEKFSGFHVKSFTIEGQNPGDAVASKPTEATAANSSTPVAVNNLAADSQKKPAEAVPFTNNAAQTPIAISPTNNTVQAVPVSAPQQEVAAVDGANQTAEITDRTKLDELAVKVYDRINQTWQTSPTFTQNLVYRVSTSPDGAIAHFEPLNQPAKDFTKDTPLPNILQSSQAGSSEAAAPAAKFTVVFAPSGVLEVNP